jgi:hypothetical protein
VDRPGADAAAGSGNILLLLSDAGSSPEAFAKNLPTLLRIWGSWKIDDRVYQERLNRAVASMQACTRIIREANAYRQEAMERASIAWDHHIRDTWPYDDLQTGRRYEGPLDVEGLVRGLNESEGWSRYQVTPYQHLNR